MRPNKAKAKLRAGQPVLALEGFHHPDGIEVLGPLNPDAFWLEGEHGPVDFCNVGDLTRAADLAGATSIVRVNQNVPGVIYRTLDLGAQGIVVPHVNTRAEAEAVVQAGKFAPIGMRGMFTSRQGIGVPDYFERANDETLFIILIEDIIAVENLDEILTVDHLDVFFVAPADLGQTMGHIGEEIHPEVGKVIDDSLRKIVAAGRNAGAVATAETAPRYVEMGVRFFLTGALPWIESGLDDMRSRLKAYAGA